MPIFLRWLWTAAAVMLALLPLRPACAAPPSDINIGVQEFRLANGMLFLVVERHATPQVACRLAIRAGSALEESGKTGTAHMLEHMMFKGTRNFGTRDPELDAALQQRIEAAYQKLVAERNKRDPDEKIIQSQLDEMAALRRQVQQIYVPQAFSSQLGRNGAVGVNAFTSRDQTQYILSIPSDTIEQWFSIVSEQIFEPSWREFYVEKSVVQREWGFRYVNNPAGAAWLDLNSTAYSAHPYRNPVIGWKSDIERFSTRDAAAFHQAFYHPANAVAVLVGDVTVAQVRALAETYFSRYPAGRRVSESVTSEPVQQGPRRAVRYLPGARTPLVRIGYHAAPMGSDDFYALDVLTMVLSHGRGARLTQDLVNTGQAASAWAYNPDNRFGGMVILGGEPSEPQGLAKMEDSAARRAAHLSACRQLEARLLAQLEVLAHQPVSDRELARVKKLNQRDMLDRMRSNEDLASTLATMEVQTGWRYLNTYLQSIARVSAADVTRVARTYFGEENRTSVFVIPGDESQVPPEPYEEIRSLGTTASVVRPTTDLVNRSNHPTPEGWKHPLSFERRPSKIDYPAPVRFQVRGTEVFFRPDPELPLVDLTLLVRAGEVDLPVGSTGLGQLLNRTLIRGGSQSHDPEELAVVLDENAIGISFSVRGEETAISLSVLKEDWFKGLELLGEILTRPRFDPAVLEAVRDQILTGLRRQGENARSVADREATIRHFEGHPYGRDPLRALETLPALTADDLRQFLRHFIVGEKMVAAVSGDIDPASVQDGLNQLLGQLPAAGAPERSLAEPNRTPPFLGLVHKPGQVQAQITLMLPGIPRNHHDFWKLNLAASIFGGGDSLLYTRLRDDLGLVYSTGFYQTYKWHAGVLRGYIGCRSDKTRLALSETIGLMHEMGRQIPPDRFELKRLDALNSFVFNVDTPAKLMEVYGRYRLRGEPLNTLDRIQEQFMRTERETLQTLSGRYLRPEELQIVVVADKTTPVANADTRLTLEEDLKRLAAELEIPFREIALR